MLNELTVGSLFSGIGGLELGLERAGMITKWQVEINPFCLAVLTEHWPNVTRFEDVRKVGIHNLEQVDLICGGFPCQDISKAGRGSGISGTRSGLWSEFARIIGELRPTYVLVENVPTLKTRGLEVILADLASCGYDAEWDCIPAISVGAPHRRDRLFVLAYPPGFGRLYGQVSLDSTKEYHQTQRESFAGSINSNLADPNGELTSERRKRKVAKETSVGRADDRTGGDWLAEREESVFSTGKGSGITGTNSTPFSDWWTIEPNVGRVANGIPARMDRLTALGNAVVPQVAEWIGQKINASRTNGRLLEDDSCADHCNHSRNYYFSDSGCC